MSSDSPPTPTETIYYEDPLATATILVFLPFMYLFYINRTVFPLAQREPIMALISMILGIIFMSIRLYQEHHVEIVALMAQIVTFGCAGGVLAVYFTRAWKLFMDSGITQERLNNRMEWFLKHRYLRSKKFLAQMIAAQMLFELILLLVAALTNSESVLEPSRIPRKSRGAQATLGVLAGVYFLAFIGFGVRLAGKKDGFHIKRELRFVGLGTIPLIIAWFLQFTLKPPCEVHSCASLIFWGLGAWVLSGTLVFPLAVAYLRSSRFRFLPAVIRKRGMSDSKQSSQSATKGEQHKRGHARALSMSEQEQEKLQKVPLAKFLTSDTGKEAFRAFLVTEFSVENLMFVEVVQRLQNNPSASQAEINELYEKYLADSAPSQVNLPSVVMQKLNARLEEGGEAQDLKLAFNEAHDHVMKLMHRDSWKRFQQTPEWQQHVVVFAETAEKSQTTDSVTVTSDLAVASSESLEPFQSPQTPTSSSSSSSSSSSAYSSSL